mgnify:CR=1 FL=1
MMTVTMSKKGEIVIPKKIREEAGFAPGTDATVIVHNGIIEIRPRIETSTEIIKRWEPRAKAHNMSLDGIDFDARIEEETTLEAVREQLMAIESMAHKKGQVLLVIPASVSTLSEVGKWAETLGKKGFILVPVSALARAKFS